MQMNKYSVDFYKGCLSTMFDEYRESSNSEVNVTLALDLLFKDEEKTVYL